MKSYPCIERAITLCLFILLIYPNNVNAQFLPKVKGVVKNMERSAVKQTIAPKIMQSVAESSSQIDSRQITESKVLQQSLLKQLETQKYNRMICNSLADYSNGIMRHKKLLYNKRLCRIPQILYTKQFVYNGNEEVEAFVLPTQNKQITLFILDKKSVRTQNGLKKDFSCFLHSNMTNQQVGFRFYDLNTKEVQHILHRLDILQTNTANEMPAFIGNFSKAKIFVNSEHIDIIVPATSNNKQYFGHAQLLLRVMGALPISLRNVINKCIFEKTCTPEAVVLQLMNDLMNHQINPENLKCELIQGIMALNDIKGTDERDYFA